MVPLSLTMEYIVTISIANIDIFYTGKGHLNLNNHTFLYHTLFAHVAKYIIKINLFHSQHMIHFK